MATLIELRTDCVNPRPYYIWNRRERICRRVGCNRYGCRECGERKRRRLIQRMLKLEGTHLLTLTLPSERGYPTRENLEYFHARRRVFFRWMQRQPWGMVKHGWIREIGEIGGRLHLHALVRMRSRFLPYARIQEVAANCGLGVVDFQSVWRREGAARYVAKYTAKGFDVEDGELAGCRRFGMTPGHNLSSNPDWQLLRRGDVSEWEFPGAGVALVIEPWDERVPALIDRMYAIPPPS